MVYKVDEVVQQWLIDVSCLYLSIRQLPRNANQLCTCTFYDNKTSTPLHGSTEQGRRFHCLAAFTVEIKVWMSHTITSKKRSFRPTRR